MRPIITASKSRDIVSLGNTQVDRDSDDDPSINEQPSLKGNPSLKENWSS